MKYLLLLLLIFELTFSFAQVSVKGYYRKNGTYVRPHQRTRPNNTVTDNYSYKGNTNPYTGKIGTKTYNKPTTHDTRTYSNVRTIKIHYTEEYEPIKKAYEGTRTTDIKDGKQHYTAVKTPYAAKINTMSRFYTTYDLNKRGEFYEPFLNAGTTVEVLGRNKEGMYLVKYEDREGFIKETEIDSIAIRKMSNAERETNEMYRRFGEIDTSNYALGVVIAELAVFRNEAETKESNIISRLPNGSILKVIAYHSNGFWVVKSGNNLGFMMDAFYRLLSDKEVITYHQTGSLTKQKDSFPKKGLFSRRKHRLPDDVQPFDEN